jgi:hypothetical protein
VIVDISLLVRRSSRRTLAEVMIDETLAPPGRSTVTSSLTAPGVIA